MTKSLYTVLNVAPTADPAVIEAAYKALMKKYHPDMLSGSTEGDPQKAAEINQAFQILKDPERRARYDSDQRARVEAIRRAAMAAAPPSQVYHPPRRQRRRSRWPVILLVAAAATAIILWWQDPDRAREFLGSQMHALSPEASAAPGAADAIDEKNIDQAVAEYRHIKGKTGLLGLSAFSEDCFANQSRSPTARALDFCVAFDHAAERYGAKIAGDDLPQLPRFRPEEMEIRHETAARLVSDDDSWISTRRARLRDLTLAKLELAEPSAPSAAQAALAVTSRVPEKAERSRPHARQDRGRQRSPRQRADRDFLEREGYIY